MRARVSTPPLPSPALPLWLAALTALSGCSEPSPPGGRAAAPAHLSTTPPAPLAPPRAAAPAACAASLTPASVIVPSGGAARRIGIKAAAECAWLAEGRADWIRIAENERGQGDGVIAVTFLSNPGPDPRSATLVAGGKELRIFQDGERALVHPRLWVDPAAVERLKGWARDDNPVYKSWEAALKTATSDYDTRFATGKWADNGGVTFSSDVSEAYAEFFAFASLLAKTAEARDDAARRARALIMFVIDKASLGPAPGKPFRDVGMGTHDRGSWWGEGFSLTVDWIYPYLSAADKAKIRTVLLRFAAANLKTSNAPWLITADHGPPLRWAANNYYLAHLRNLTLMSLAFDPKDDPAVEADKPRLSVGNSLESYFNEVTERWLPPLHAIWKDGGDASGGLPAEGFLYGSAIGMLHQGLLAMFTAGRLSPLQESLMAAPYWDRLIAGFFHSIAPAPKVLPGLGYLGPVYVTANYGDVLRSWAIPEWINLFASLGAHDASTGNAARAQTSRWIATHALEGGAGKLGERVANIWPNGKATAAILSLMLFDPGAPAPSDPRPALPLTFFDRSLGRVLSRTDWGPNASWFAFGCTWKAIPHQRGDCGQFDLYRKGEWLTTERSGYSVDGTIGTTDYHNTLSLENNRLQSSAMSWFEPPINQRGSQYVLGLGTGDPSFRASERPGFVHAEADATPLYNRGARGGVAADIELASRSIVYLPPDHVVIYDQAASRAAGRFKRFNLMLPAEPTITGHTATATTASGQQIFLDSLLPAAAKISRSPDEKDQTAEGGAMRVRLIVEDPSKPREVRFLHVLEGADAGAAHTPPRLFRAGGDMAFEGALVRGTAVLFSVKPLVAGGFKGLSYTVPLAIKAHLITGLPPGGYDIAQKAAGGRMEISVTPGSAVTADEAGGIAVGFAGAK